MIRPASTLPRVAAALLASLSSAQPASAHEGAARLSAGDVEPPAVATTEGGSDVDVEAGGARAARPAVPNAEGPNVGTADADRRDADLRDAGDQEPGAERPDADGPAPRFETRLELWVGAAAVGFAVADLGGEPGDELLVQTREPGRLHLWSGLSPELGGRSEGVSVEVPSFGVGPVVWPAAAADVPAAVLVAASEPPALLSFEPRWDADVGRFTLEPGPTRELSGQVRAVVVDRPAPEAAPLLAVALQDHAERRASLALFDWPDPLGRVELGDELPTCVAFAPRAGRLVVGCQRGPSLRLIERTAAGFVETASAPLPGIPRALCELELDGDAAPELVVVGGDDSVWVLGFEEGGSGEGVSFADDVADGALDTLVAWRSGGIPIDVLPWTPPGADRPALTVLSWADMVLATADRFQRGGPAAPDVRYAGLSPRDLGQGDLDGDGFADLLASNPDSGTVSLWFGDAEGLPTAPRLPAPPAPFSLDAGELDGDGLPDLVTLSAIESVVTVHLSASGETRDLPTAGGATRCCLTDVDGDGRTDLALLREARAAAGLEVWLGDGEGGLAPSPALPPLPLGRDVVTLAAGEVDGRPGAELFVVLGADHELLQVGLADGRLAVRGRLELDGQGTAIALERGADGRVRHVALAESAPDLARLRLIEPRADGSLVELGRMPLPRPADALAVGDVDGDGASDLAVAMSGASGTQPGSLLTVLSAFGADGERRTLAPETTGPNPRSVALADLDGDGHDELVATSLGWNHLRIWSWSGRAGGGLRHGWDLGAHRAVLEVLCLDLEGDGGPPTLLVCNNFSSDLSVIRLAR